MDDDRMFVGIDFFEVVSEGIALGVRICIFLSQIPIESEMVSKARNQFPVIELAIVPKFSTVQRSSIGYIYIVAIKSPDNKGNGSISWSKFGADIDCKLSSDYSRTYILHFRRRGVRGSKTHQRYRLYVHMKVKIRRNGCRLVLTLTGKHPLLCH